MSGHNVNHDWQICNEQSGYLIVEGCYNCNGRISFFSEEVVPPKDDYKEGKHYWSYETSYQAMKFDLRCSKCGNEVHLKDVMALMLCNRCDPECKVYQEGEKQSVRRAWVYVALCANSTHETGICISDEGITALNEYFNAGLADSEKKIIVLPCNQRKSVDRCQGIVLADVGLTELY